METIIRPSPSLLRYCRRDKNRPQAKAAATAVSNELKKDTIYNNILEIEKKRKNKKNRRKKGGRLN